MKLIIVISIVLLVALWGRKLWCQFRNWFLAKISCKGMDCDKCPVEKECDANTIPRRM